MDKEPTAKDPIKVNIIKDKKQMRVTIPAWIIENFRINPENFEFIWYIQEVGRDESGEMHVTPIGKFVRKIPKKSNDKE